MNFTKAVMLRLAAMMLAWHFLGMGDPVWAQSTEVVGETGDPAKLVFEGNEYFSADNIRNGLLQSPEFLLASHPSAPAADYPPALAAVIKSGYEAGGFPEAEIKTSVDADKNRILVKIKEGPQYVMADIHISGARKIPGNVLINKLKEKPDSLHHTTELISERLTSYQSSGTEDDAVWNKGATASLGEVAQEKVAIQVKALLSQLGFDQAKLNVQKVPNREKHTVDLMIAILEEGPSGKVGEIEITGLKRNQRDDVLKYLELKPGLKFNRELQEKLERRLWESARFISFKISMTNQENSHDELVKLNIELNEYSPLPPLREKLSRDGQALVRLSGWLSGPESAGEDIVLDLESFGDAGDAARMRFIFSPRGLLIAKPGGDSGQPASLRYAGVLSDTMAGVFNFRNQNKLASPTALSNVVLKAFVRVLGDAETTNESPFSLSAGGGFNFKEENRPEFVFDRFFNPAAFVRLAYDKDKHVSFNHGQMTLTNENFELRIEEKTGRLLELTVHDTNDIKGRLRIENGAFARAREEIITAGGGYHNAYEPKQPLNSTASFLIGEVLQADLVQTNLMRKVSPEQSARAVAAIKRILDERPFSPLDDMILRRSFVGIHETFAVPADYYRSQNPMNMFMAVVSGMVFKYGNDLFPRNSWPWTVMREAVFVVGGNGKYTGAELKRLMDAGETGPVGYDVIGRLLAKAGSPMAKAIAIQGLTHLDKQDFRKDWELALQKDCVLKQIAENLARSLAHLNEQDAAALAEIMRPEDAIYLRPSVKALQNRGDRNLADTLGPILDDYWDKRLREKVRADLKKQTTAPD